jgi:ubiquinone/menaquinone biosynthesis C-methylase UbiE
MFDRTPDFLWKLWYPLLTRLTRSDPILFLNYGFAERGAAATPRLALAEEDEPNRPCIQLYDSVVRPVDLRGRSVLEVSCGHGGGASFIARYAKPGAMYGVDRNARAVRLCEQRHDVPGLSFSCGDALALGFDDQSFDAVVNVEASHCYPDVSRFFREVVRVLRPGGHFLYADFRRRDPDSAVLHRRLEESGMEVLERQDITANVVGGMEANTEKYTELIRQFAPAWLRKTATRFAGVVGSPIHRDLASGETVYLRYVLRKRSPDVAHVDERLAERVKHASAQ